MFPKEIAYGTDVRQDSALKLVIAANHVQEVVAFLQLNELLVMGTLSDKVVMPHTWGLKPLGIGHTEPPKGHPSSLCVILGQGCWRQPCPGRRRGRGEQLRRGGRWVNRAVAKGVVWGSSQRPGPYAQAAALTAPNMCPCK